MITIKQLAKIAGVSPTTVANALHGRGHKMTSETLKKVRQVIREMKYVPNMGGRLLGNHGSRIIGVIISSENRDKTNIIQGSFFSDIIGELENRIRQNGYFMMLYTAANVEESVRMAGAWNIEGLIVMGCHLEECSRFLKSTSIPLVFIDSYFLDDGLPYSCVGLEDKKGGYLMAKHLIDKGHRNICFLATGDPSHGVFYERYCGCKEAMKEGHLSFGIDDLFSLSFTDGSAQKFLQRFLTGRIKYTAFFFAYDFLALCAVSFLQDNGINIPRDISVCGFDGNIFSTLFKPPLTTVRQNIGEKASQTVAMLMQMIKKETPEQRIVRLSVSLHEGESVRDIS
jgi:LacI family transcriptional regulator